MTRDDQDFLAELLSVPALRDEIKSMEGAIYSARTFTRQKTLQIDFSDRRVRYSAEDVSNMIRYFALTGVPMISRSPDPYIYEFVLRYEHCPSN